VTRALPKAWEDSIGGWLSWLQLSGLSPSTIRLRYDQARVIARRSRTQQPADVTLGVLVTMCTAEDWSREHRKGVRTSLVSFFDFYVDNGPYAR
jgi:hypothetical protein